MKNIIVVTIFFSLAFFNFYCNDGIHGSCTSLSDEFCTGVEDCMNSNGDKYIKVGSDRHYCVQSLVSEDTYDCSDAYALADLYCEGSNPNTEVDLYEQCYRTDTTGNKICYGSLLSKEQCDACGWYYSTVECDSNSAGLIYSPPNCQ